LASRLSHTDITLPAATHKNSFAILAPRPTDGSVLAWWDESEHLHVTPLNAKDERAGDDHVIMDRVVNRYAAVVAHEAGFAAFMTYVRDWWPSAEKPNDGFFVRIGGDGKPLFNLHIADNISGFYTAGKIAWSGSRYVAYYPISKGGHEGDTLGFYSASAEKLDGGWDWGCSHSGDQRIHAKGDTFAVVCSSDMYPQKGIIFQTTGALIQPEPKANGAGYFGEVELGQLLASDTGYFHIYTSAIDSVNGDKVQDRAGQKKDVALVSLDSKGGVQKRIWLSDTDVAETKPNVAWYGKNLFVAFGVTDQKDKLSARVLSPSGDVVSAAETLAADIAAGDEIITHGNGDLGWARAGERTQQSVNSIRVYRLKACD
jgi:hypothetical protein